MTEKVEKHCLRESLVNMEPSSQTNLFGPILRAPRKKTKSSVFGTLKEPKINKMMYLAQCLRFNCLSQNQIQTSIFTTRQQQVQLEHVILADTTGTICGIKVRKILDSVQVSKLMETLFKLQTCINTFTIKFILVHKLTRL